MKRLVISRIVCLTVLARHAMDATPALTLMTHAALNALEGQIEASGGHGETLVLEGEPLAVIKRVSRPMPLVPLPEDQ